MSLSRILNTARTALLMHQRSMQVTANNIANSQTPGYSRQRLILQSTATGLGGVMGGGIERIRDGFLDSTFRRELGMMENFGTSRFLLEQIESAVNEPSDTGITTALDDLFQAFGDLSNDPNSPVGREEVRRAARQLAHRMRSVDESVRRTLDHAEERLRLGVSEVNDLTERIAQVNKRIQGTGGNAGPELLDQRDQLLDELAGYLAIDTHIETDGSVTVSTDGTSLVSGGTAQELEVIGLPDGGSGFGVLGAGEALEAKEGSLASLVTMTSTTLPDMLKQLDTLAEALVTEINAVHRTGEIVPGVSAGDFFDPDGVTAGTLALSTAVENSAESIATGNSTAGDNGVVLQLASLSGALVGSLGDRSFGNFYTDFAAGVGRQLRSALDGESVAQAMTDQADARRMSVAGVSIDEEMVTLISQQEAYSAAARLVSVADEMMQEVLRMTG